MTMSDYQHFLFVCFLAMSCSGESSSLLQPQAASQEAAALPSRASMLQPFENPFEQPGQYGIGNGWKIIRSEGLGTATQEDSSLHIHIPPGTEEHTILVCQTEETALAPRTWVRGRYRSVGLETPHARSGGIISVRFLDANKKLIQKSRNNQALINVQGTTNWQDFTTLLEPPKSAVEVRLCVAQRRSLGGSLWVRDLGLTRIEAEPPPSAPNILFLVVDALRARSLGLYGERLPVSPHIDALSRRGRVYDLAWTQYTWTVPSFISYMLAQYPRTHGWTWAMDTALDLGISLDRQFPMLASVLQDAGYVTVSYYSNAFLKRDFGLDTGFDIWRLGNDTLTTQRAIAEIERWSSDSRPNFMYVHLMAPHVPLCPPDDAFTALGVEKTPAEYLQFKGYKCPDGGLGYWRQYKKKVASEEEHGQRFRTAYMAAIRDADRNVGEILSALDETGLTDETLVIFTADHGELLGEHGIYGHGSYVYEELSSVPLVLVGRGIAPGRESSRVGQLVDLAPTILDYAGLGDRQPTAWQGGSLFQPQRSEVAVCTRNDEMAFTRDGRWKIVESTHPPVLTQAYALQGEEGEERSIHANPPEEIQELVALAHRWREEIPEGRTRGEEISLNTRDKRQMLQALRTLGYVE